MSSKFPGALVSLPRWDRIGSHEQLHELRECGGESTLSPFEVGLVRHRLAEHPNGERRDEIDGLIETGFGTELARDDDVRHSRTLEGDNLDTWGERSGGQLEARDRANSRDSVARSPIVTQSDVERHDTCDSARILLEKRPRSISMIELHRRCILHTRLPSWHC